MYFPAWTTPDGYKNKQRNQQLQSKTYLLFSKYVNVDLNMEILLVAPKTKLTEI